MSEISTEIGQRIRNFRKMRHMTLENMASAICKSKSTISKYEKGEIAIDIETLYEIAEVLGIHVEQLLFCSKERVAMNLESSSNPAFFSGLSRFYSYYFDGRSNKVIPSVFDVMAKTQSGRYKVMVYMNFKNYDEYQICENTYWGYIEHYDAVTNILLTNQDTSMERASVQVLAPYLDGDYKWGLWKGFSNRPLMPIAAKMLVTKEPMKIDDNFIEKLKISKEDIKLLKTYNMLIVV